ncbi:MAG: hypothetical protein AAF480_04110 [Actinomycetota bacterium]
MGDEPVGDDEEADGAGALRKAAGLAKSAVSGAVDYVGDRRFERTPAGRARSAYDDGAATFLIRIPLDDVAHRSEGGSVNTPDAPDAIGHIEAEGWVLAQLDYVTETAGWEDVDDGGTIRRGARQLTLAVLLFRRA